MRFARLENISTGERKLAVVTQNDNFVSLDALCAAGGEALDQSLIDPDGNGWLAKLALSNLFETANRTGLDGLDELDTGTWWPKAPVARPGKIIAVGRNYMDHVREGQEIWAKRGRKVEVPTFPTAFAKFPSSICGPYDEVIIPEGHDDIDYEVELAVVIGEPVKDVPRERALDCVAGYMICNDLAARGIQRREMEAQIGITLAKNFPTFAPMGPWLTTSDDVGDPQALQVTLEVDGDVRQDANTSDMIFPVDELIAYWSRVGLRRGDILITGTPSGVALARENPEEYYLRSGQLVVARIEKLGEIRNRMRGVADESA